MSGRGQYGSTSRGRNFVDSVEVRSKRFGNHHGAIRLLVVFQDSQPGSSNSYAAAVQSVEKLRLSLPATSKANVGATGLKSPQFEQEEISLYSPAEGNQTSRS